jgi:integrase
VKPLAVTQIRRGSIVELWVGDKTKAMSILDFEAAGFPETVAEAVARAFVALQGGNTVESQNANWRLIRKFGNFLAQKHGDIKKIPADSLKRFDSFLAESGDAQKTRGAAYNAAYRLLNWLLRNAKQTIDHSIRLDRSQGASLAKSLSKSRDEPPDEALVTRILSCCYEEITAAEIVREKIRSVPLNTQPNVFSDILLFLLKVGGGYLPTMEQLSAVPGGINVKRILGSFGGAREIYSQYYISISELFPYYLAILVQASANPQSLLKADKDCIVEIPFRQDLERFVWNKNRSGRLQTPDFSKNKEWAAPNIARKLLAQNSELRGLAPLIYRDALFICRTHGMEVSLPSWQSIHTCLKEFRAKHELPHFNLTDLRRAGALMHHKAGRSILAAQQRLQHKSPIVTQRYTALEDLSVQHQQNIRRFQGLMLQAAGKVLTPSRGVPWVGKSEEGKAETLFGFQCSDPLAGLAEGSRPGVPCPKFQQCSSCSGAIVVVDDPSNVARLISASEHLSAERERAIREGWSKRFDLLYQPTIDVLRSDIFPAISKSVWQRALTIASLPLPRLE